MPNSKVDNRIVEMEFDNARFEKNVNQSISSLDRFKQALNMDGAAKSFNRVEKQANSIDFSGLERSITNIEHRFSALGIAGATVINTITNKALGALGNLNHAVFGQMKSGGISRALNLEHANFMMEGLLKDSAKVAEIMKEGGPVQNAVKGTAYGLDAAANAAAQFVASGITDSKKLEAALTGISGAAAMTGSSYEDISRIFTTVAGNGRLMGDQLLQFSGRGLNVASELAKSLGKTEAEIRDMVSKGKIDFETFATVMNDAFGTQAKKANETFTGALSNVKAALSRIGAKVAAPTIENLRTIFVSLITVIDNANKALTPFIDFINNAIYSISSGILDILGDTETLNGIITNVVATMGEVFRDIASFIIPLKRAFSDVFPARTMGDALTLTERIKELAATLRLSEEGMVTFRRIFRGVFSVIDIGVQIISSLIRVLFPATNGIKGFANGFFNAAATLGDYLYAISKVLRETDALYYIFSLLKEKIGGPVGFVVDKIKSLIGLFKELKASGKFSIPKIDGIGSISEALSAASGPLEKAGSVFKFVFGLIGEAIKNVSPLLGTFASVCGNSLVQIGEALTTVLSGGGFKTLLALVNTAFLTTIGLDIAAFIHHIIGSFSRGLKLIDGIKGLFANVSLYFKTMAMSVKADVLMKIAKAIAVLAGSLFVLSLIPVENLTRALIAIGLLGAELAGLMYAFTKMADTMKGMGAFLSGGLGFAAIAAGVLLLAGAMKTIASIPKEDLMDCLGTISALLLELVGVALILGNFGEKMTTGVTSIIAFSVAIKILAGAMESIADLEWDQLGKGLLGISVAMLELSAAALLIGESDFGVSAGLGILAMAAALKIIGSVIAQVGDLKPEQIVKGLLGIGFALSEIGIFMAAMGDVSHLLGTAAAIGVLSLALLAITNAMTAIGSMSPQELATAIIGIGAALAFMGVTLAALSGIALQCIGAAAAIGLLAISLNLLIPILTLFSNMEIGELGMAIGGLAATFVVLGVAAAIFGAAAGPLLIGAGVIAALGAACLVSAAGMAATAIAMGMLATAFEDLTTLKWTDLLSGIGKLLVAFTSLSLMSILIAPVTVEMLALAASLAVISLAAMGLAASISIAAIGTSLMADALKKFEDISWGAIGKGLVVLVASLASLGLAAALLAPVSPVILAIGVGIAAMGAGALMTAGALILFAKAIELLMPIVERVVPVIAEMASNIWDYICQLASNIWSGLVNFSANVLKWIVDLGGNLLKGIVDFKGNILHKLVDFGGEMLKALGVPEDWVEVAKDFMHGLITGITDGIKNVIDSVVDVGKSMIEGIRDAIDSHSDSKETIAVGHDFDGGLITGVGDLKDKVVAAVADVGKGMLDQAKSDAFKVGEVWEAVNKIYGRNLEFEQGLKNGTIKSIAGVGYFNTKTGETKDLLHESIDAIQQETTSLGSNSSAVDKSSKSKEKNKKANNKKTKAIKEETEATEEETEAVEDNEQAIRDMAEAIEVVTEAYDENLNWTGLKDNFKIIKSLKNTLSTLWSGLNTGSLGNFDDISASLSRTTDRIAKGTYRYNDVDKMLKKLTKTTLQSGSKIRKEVESTGRTIAKVYEGSAKVFYKTNRGVEKLSIALPKSAKNISKYFKQAKTFADSFEGINIGEKIINTEDSKTFIETFRDIEKYFGGLKKSQMTKGLQSYLSGIVEQMSDVKDAMDTLGKQIDGVKNINSKNSRSTVYVTDAFLALGAALYDGSEAANEYATEHARLQFLMEHGLATEDEVAEHFESYISRISQALVEYKNSITENLIGSLDIWEKFDKHLLDDSVDLISNLESQIAGMQEWSDMLMELSKRGFDSNVLKSLADEGTSSYGKLKKLLEMTGDELALWTVRYQTSQKMIETTTNTVLAAVANAQTRASQRAAAKSGDKIAQKQLKQSKKVMQQQLDEVKSVAQAQANAKYLTNKQEKAYLKTLTKEERALYKKSKKEARAAQKELERAAAAEEAKRAEENRLKTVLDSIKTLEDYVSVITKYSGDASVMTDITNKMTKAFEPINDALSNVSSNAGNASEAMMLFAETLDATGEEGLNYFEEMSKRVQNFMEDIKSTVTSVSYLTSAFEKASKIKMADIYNNGLSNIAGDLKASYQLEQLSKKGYNSYVLQDAINTWKSDRAKGIELMKTLNSADAAYVEAFNAIMEERLSLGTDISNKAAGVMASAKSKAQIENEVKRRKVALDEVTNARIEAENKVADLQKSLSDKIAERDAYALTKKENKRYKQLLKYGKLTKKQESELASLANKISIYTHKGVEAANIQQKITNAETELNKLRMDETEKLRLYNEQVKVLEDYTNKLNAAQDKLVKEAKLKMWFEEAAVSIESLYNALSKVTKGTNEYVYAVGQIADVMKDYTEPIALFNLEDNFKNIKSHSTELPAEISIIEDGFLQFGKSLVDVTEDADTFWESMVQGLKDYQVQLKSSIEQSSNFFSMFSGFSDEDNPLSATNYLEYADSQIEALKKWQEYLKTVTDKGLRKELVENFASQGLGSFEQLAAWAAATEAQIGEYNKLWDEYQTQLENASNTALASIAASWSTAGQALSESMIDYFGANGAERLTNAGYQASAMVITGITNGIEEAMPTIISAVEKTTPTAVATGVARTIGAAIDEGLVNAVSASVTDTINAAVEKFKMAVDSVNLYVQEMLPTDFTITVHVDTSEIDAAVARMNEAIAMTNVSAGTTSQAVTTSRDNQNTPTVVTEPVSAGNTTTVQLTQNNYSPKALSQVEIYRDMQAAGNQIKNILELQNRG